MSTPVDLNIAMPYGVTVEGDGQSRKAVPVTKSSKVDSGNRLRLTSGPCRIAASWSGPEEVRVTIFGVGYPLTIPAGGGYRSAMVSVGAKYGDAIYLENAANAPLPKGTRGTLEVFPLSFE